MRRPPRPVSHHTTPYQSLTLYFRQSQMSPSTKYSGFEHDDHDGDCHDGEDLEALHSPSTAAGQPGKNPLRMLFLMLRANEILISKSREVSSPSISYSLIGTSDTDDDDDPTSSNCHGSHEVEDDLEAQHSLSTRSLSLTEISSTRHPFIGTSDTDGYQDSGPKGTVRSAPLSSQVLVHIHSDENDGRIIANAHPPHVQGIAEAPGSDSETGIQGDAWDHHSGSPTPILQTKPARITIMWCLLRACSSYMIVLLLIYLALALFYWIKKEGLEVGLCVGFVIFVAIFILVVIHAVVDYVHETKQSEKGFLMRVTTTGMNLQLSPARCKTPLQASLDKLFTWLEYLVLLNSIFTLVEMLVRLLCHKEHGNPGLPPFKIKPSTFKDLMDRVNRIDLQPVGKIRFFTALYNILLVAMLEGIPLVITLSVEYWNKKMLSGGKGYVQGSLACVNMGSVTTICIDKLSGEKMSQVQVERFRIGEEDIEGESAIDQNVQDALCEGIYAMVLEPKNSSSSETEGIVFWAQSKLGMDQDCLKQSCALVETNELNSNEERSPVLMRKSVENETVTFLHRNGPATTILDWCSFYYDSQGGINQMIGKKMYFEKFIEENQSKHLKTIAFAYNKTNEYSRKTNEYSREANELILIGLLVLKEKDWTETRKAVEACRNGGIKVIMISHDNTQALEAMASQCGLLGPCSLVLDANDFRSYTKEEMMERVDRITVMGNSLPSDRVVLVEYLKRKGQTVAVIGAAGTNETASPAIEQSYLGMIVEIWSAKMLKGTCDLVLSNDNFSSLVSIIRHGRCAYENIQKYIQYDFTVVISGLLISLISTGLMGDSPFASIQLQLGSVIVVFPGGFALSFEPPPDELAGNQAARQGGKLISMVKWRSIIIQVTYQVSILVTISQFEGKPVLGIGPRVNRSLVFNSYILCQVFNLFNCRRPEKKNIFKGIHKKPCLSMAAVAIMGGLQAALIVTEPFVGGSPRLDGGQWMVCLLIGMGSWVIDYVGKFASDITISFWHKKELPQVPPET